ncbi:MAG: hypothetical protein JHD15_08040 [Phenylobacterium sp.]|uniref:hypothetical protein n=1 Tax=Phenylobacterium sp. TaxID=1871053 RepID=UPI001A355F0F|nr:hypothetical protein [Phenylobacterium sp.]MBJ7410301.1 hypothetical protein [Phenylobacterium sp.]
MRRRSCALALGAFAATLLVPGLAAADPSTGKVILEMRLRSETVDQDGFGKDAHALTLRTRLGYETPGWNGFKALVEGENVAVLDDSYNSTVNGKVHYPVVTDPKETELNRAQVSWSGAQGDVVVGRQRIILGAARFVGNVGFRQNEQTFDAAKAAFRPTKDVTLTYAYVDRVHRIFGDHSAQGEWDSDSHLMQAEAKTGVGQASAYGHLLDFGNAPAQSSATWGLRLAGSRPLRAGLALTYEIEAARQTDYANSPTDFELGYLALGAGLKSKTRWASLGYEGLDGDGRRGFQTPLATLHAFQGWADVFLTTPPAGVRDLNLRAGATVPVGRNATPLKLQVAAHDFTDDDGSRRYGRELDLLVGAPLTKALSAEVKAALFDGARPGFADRTKVWMTLEYRY